MKLIEKHRMTLGALLMLLVIVLPLCAVGIKAGDDDHYATFFYAGREYAVSEVYEEHDWYGAVDFCADLGSGWRLPTLDEALAMRDGYAGSDPLGLSGQPSWCMEGFRSLWTATECDGGMHFIYPLTTALYDGGVPIMECEDRSYDGPSADNQCCLAKSGYQSYHVCPMARCVRALESEPTETPPVTGVYYVAPNGSDSNPGTMDRPWRTIQKAANTLRAGETVYIREGTYHEQVVPRYSGSAGNYITFAAYPGETPTLDGGGVSMGGWEGLIWVHDVSYIEVRGLQVQNVTSNHDHQGILVKNASHVNVRDCSFYNVASSGIGVWNCSDVEVTGNELEEVAISGDSQESLTIAQTHGFIVDGNHVHHSGLSVPAMGGEGIDAKGGSSDGRISNNHVHHIRTLGLYVDSYGNTRDIRIYGNIVHDCDAEGMAVCAESGGPVENVYLYNNLVYGNGRVGICLGCWGSGSVRNVQLVNNTTSGNQTGVWVRNVTEALVRNNLSPDGIGAGSATADHNWTGPGGFVNPGAGDFHLRGDSPAVDNGSALSAPRVDLDGVPRPQGAGYDIGAYEYAGSIPSRTPTRTPGPSRTPTRASTATARPTGTPTARPTGTPTARPTGTPTATPTRRPTRTPTARPTRTPTRTPRPTVTPTATPSPVPTNTVYPTATGTTFPTETPAVTPTSTPPPPPDCRLRGQWVWCVACDERWSFHRPQCIFSLWMCCRDNRDMSDGDGDGSWSCPCETCSGIIFIRREE